MTNKNNSRAAAFPFPVLIVIVYLLMGYLWDLWNPGWLIFLTIPLYYFTVTAIENAKKGHKSRIWRFIPFPVICAIVYLVLGMFYDLWHPAWIIFLTIPLWTFFVNGKYADENDSVDE